MGAAAYNRGSRAITHQIAREGQDWLSLLARDLDATPKHKNAIAPFAPIHFVAGNGGFWAQCPTSGFGYHYPTLRQALSAWLVTITAGGVINGEWVWVGTPHQQQVC